jgi:hypothetical protein
VLYVRIYTRFEDAGIENIKEEERNRIEEKAYYSTSPKDQIETQVQSPKLTSPSQHRGHDSSASPQHFGSLCRVIARRVVAPVHFGKPRTRDVTVSYIMDAPSMSFFTAAETKVSV